jgi:hypothetical protein
LNVLGTTIKTPVVIMSEMPQLGWVDGPSAAPADRAAGLHERGDAGAGLFVGLVVAALIRCALASVAAAAPIAR